MIYLSLSHPGYFIKEIKHLHHKQSPFPSIISLFQILSYRPHEPGVYTQTTKAVFSSPAELFHNSTRTNSASLQTKSHGRSVESDLSIKPSQNIYLFYRLVAVESPEADLEIFKIGRAHV